METLIKTKSAKVATVAPTSTTSSTTTAPATLPVVATPPVTKPAKTPKAAKPAKPAKVEPVLSPELTKVMAQLTLYGVGSVYSGKAGKCCCGCCGKHTVNSKFQAAVSKNRGYKVGPCEINDRVVKMTIGKVLKGLATATVGSNNVSIVAKNRIHIVYLVSSYKA